MCEKTYDERIFSSLVKPIFDPGSGGVYLFDTEAKDVYRASPTTCQQVWVYLGEDDVAGFAASSSTVVGAGGTTVFALNP